jgi:hypothetical protein
MVAIENFSKIAIAVKMIAVDRRTMCEFMITIKGHLGLYGHILGEAGPFSAGSAFGDLLNTLGVKRHVTTGSHLEANRCCEHFVPTFEQSLAKQGANGKNLSNKREETKRVYN